MHKLTCHEILKHLGFKNIPEDGLDINPHDAYFNSKILNLLGESICLKSFTDSELEGFGRTLGFLAHVKNSDSMAIDIEKLKSLILAHLKISYGLEFNDENRQKQNTDT